jgi:hypothetical protein
LTKVKKSNFKALSRFVYAPESYRLSKKLHKENEEVKGKLSKGHAYDLTTNIFEKLEDLFFGSQPNDKYDYIQILGNPPYQDTNENTSDTPIYNHFFDISFRISDKVTFITPGRFLFNAGKTPKDWNIKMLNDKHFIVIWYESDSTKVFPNVDIKGGVAVTFRDSQEEFGVIGDFSPHSEVSSILTKVKKSNFKALSRFVYAPESYRLSKKLHKENEEVKGKLSKGHAYDLTTNIFEKLEDLFFGSQPNDKYDYIQILGNPPYQDTNENTSDTPNKKCKTTNW